MCVCVCVEAYCVCVETYCVCVCGNLLCVCGNLLCGRSLLLQHTLKLVHSLPVPLLEEALQSAINSTLCISISQHWRQGFIQVLGFLAHSLAQGAAHPLAQGAGFPCTPALTPPSTLFCLSGFNSLSPQKRFCLSLLSFLLLIFTAKTVLRNAEWSTTGRITQSALVVNPGNAKVQMSMGNELAQQVYTVHTETVLIVILSAWWVCGRSVYPNMDKNFPL